MKSKHKRIGPTSGRPRRFGFGKWLPGRADVASTHGSDLVPMQFETDCPGLGVHRTTFDEGFTITHTPSGRAVLNRIRSKASAKKAAMLLCKGIQQRCGITWVEVDAEGGESLRCAASVLGEIRNSIPMVGASKRRK